MTNTIPFNRPAVTGKEMQYLREAVEKHKFSGDGPMTERCNQWLKDHFETHAAFVTSSGTHALEMAALLCDLKPGDEVILPSFSFSSTASAFARLGTSLVFVDIEPSTMNLDVSAVRDAVTEKTRVIVALHYAGVGCDMDGLSGIAQEYDLIIVEDAAQGMFSNYGHRPLGAMGRFGCISFHESKNVHCGEGGALVVNDPRFVKRAEIILEKGTNRMEFRRGSVPKYTWLDLGSSYVLSELNCAYLLAQLEAGADITTERIRVWNEYRHGLQELADRGVLEIPGGIEPDQHNGHIFWVKAEDHGARDDLLAYLRARGIMATFHYVPLHTSPAGLRYGRFSGRDRYTSIDSQRLLRLPMFFGFKQPSRVVEAIHEFYGHKPDPDHPNQYDRCRSAGQRQSGN